MEVIFEKNPDVIIEKKSDTKVILHNTVTKNKTSLNDKIDIKIVLAFEDMDNKIFVEQLAKKINVDKSRIISTLKKLAKRGFISNTSEDYSAFE